MRLRTKDSKRGDKDAFRGLGIGQRSIIVRVVDVEEPHGDDVVDGIQNVDPDEKIAFHGEEPPVGEEDRHQIEDEDAEEYEHIGQQLVVLDGDVLAIPIAAVLLERNDQEPGQSQSQPDVEYVAADGIGNSHVSVALSCDDDGRQCVGDGGASSEDRHAHDGRRNAEDAADVGRPLHHEPRDHADPCDGC